MLRTINFKVSNTIETVKGKKYILHENAYYMITEML